MTRATNETLRVLQLPPVAEADVRRAVGRGVHELVKDCLRTDEPKRVARGVELFRAFYARHLTDRSRLYPGAREVLERFRPRGQAVVTNKPDPFATDLLAALGVREYFFEIVAGDSRYPKKPDPAAVLALMRQRGVEPEQTVLVGDSPIDMETGRRAGVFTAAVAHGFSDAAELSAAGAQVVVEGFDQLLAYAQVNGW